MDGAQRRRERRAARRPASDPAALEKAAPRDFIAAVFAVMARARRHTFQVLTKRPERMLRLLGDPDFPERVRAYPDLTANNGAERGAADAWPLPNVWLGMSIEQDRWRGRADLLRDTSVADAGTKATLRAARAALDAGMARYPAMDGRECVEEAIILLAQAITTAD